jgi:formylglycine-generating enzyme required for sulfatase activity
MLVVARRLLPWALPLVLCAALAFDPGAVQPAPAPLNTKVFANSVKMKLVRIGPGKFMMGSPPEEEGRQSREGPRHEVQITRAFFLSSHEVTQVQYSKVMGKNPSSFCAGGTSADAVRGRDTRDFPVDSVSWDDAVKFCTRLSALPAEKAARRAYRLPTEAEWEYACRAGTTTAFHGGTTLSPKQANFRGVLGRPCEVGSYRPNAWGLYDMHGNVKEWVADWCDPNYYARSPRKDPHCKAPVPAHLTRGPVAAHLVRGGSWSQAPMWARCAYRGRMWGPSGEHDVGFRVACDVGGRR